MNPLDSMPKWYQEITKELKTKPKQLSPVKKAIIDYLKKCIKELKDN